MDSKGLNMRGNKATHTQGSWWSARRVSLLLAAAGALPAAGLATVAVAADKGMRELAMATSGLAINLAPSAPMADKHIALGLTLVVFAAMAAFSFGLWRWQVNGFQSESAGYGR